MSILTIGGATQDIFLKCQGADFMSITKRDSVDTYLIFGSGEKIEIDSTLNLTGGGATNSSVSFARQKFQTVCFCIVGNDIAGQAVKKKLEVEGVDTSCMTIDTHSNTGTSYIINSIQGERTIFTYRGANSSLKLNNLPFDKVKQIEQLYITSLSNQAAQLLPDILKVAHQRNIPVAINPGASQLSSGATILKECLPYIDILIMNSAEAKTFMFSLIESDDIYKTALASNPHAYNCSISVSEEQPYLLNNPIPYEDLFFSIKKFFKTVLNLGPKIVVITNDCNGVYAATHDNFYFHPSIKVNVVDTVGAGDAFGSCFVGSLLKKYSIDDALRNGIMNSAEVLSHIGAKKGLGSLEAITKKTANLDKSLLQTFALSK